jgi:rhodanese-related sulfurtransferase
MNEEDGFMRRSGVVIIAVVISAMLMVSSAFAADDMAAKLNSVLSKAAAEKFWQVSPDDVKAMIDSKKTDFVVVDVRPVPSLYQGGHIPGAIYIPTQDVLKPENLKKLPKNKKIILVCVTGQTQNLPVVALRALGYDALTMKFGMAAWDKNSVGVKIMKEALQGAETKNYPVVK